MCVTNCSAPPHFNESKVATIEQQRNALPADVDDYYEIPYRPIWKMEITLAIIKPHVVRNTVAFHNIKQLIKEHFTVLLAKELHITRQLSEKFYAEHKNKFFYNRLTTFMGSGPSYALILQSPDSIAKWRKLMGPTKVYKAVHAEPDCLRALYGLSDTRNACHGSDSLESALKEIAILFPEFQRDEFQMANVNK